MEKLIKPIVRVGNSAGVLLPKGWLNGKAKVELVSRPTDIKKEILEILSPYLNDIKGVYLVGSYARGEETDESDIDVLVITDEINKKASYGKYNLIFIPEKNVRTTLEKNILPLLPMLREAKPIINKELVNEYKKIKPNKKNTKWILELTKSARKICKEGIKLSKELNENVSDGVIYSIILGLRTTYIIDCLKNGKIPTIKGLKGLIIDLANSEEPYNAYLRLKNDEPDKESISPEIAEKLNEYILFKLK
ncbi:nucleotidyltransferase domain-containing protein [Candidatus Pacearchaeota archaeon]|nr:nucleotidyltransferase domain-containing protein [Candidatus Pacearchaeota archaeon]